jgi:hypothetical protein
MNNCFGVTNNCFGVTNNCFGRCSLRQYGARRSAILLQQRVSYGRWPDDLRVCRGSKNPRTRPREGPYQGVEFWGVSGSSGLTRDVPRQRGVEVGCRFEVREKSKLGLNYAYTWCNEGNKVDLIDWFGWLILVAQCLDILWAHKGLNKTLCQSLG